jgi:murein DD-endopeptidase MepM/ murein hydrolase activator NlpD
MTQKYFVGTIGSTGTSTGPHGHFYVKDLASKKYIDPGTIMSRLTGFRVGENEIPLITSNQQGQLALNPAAGLTLTSKYGPRARPTAGASTFHQGWDLAGKESTQLKYVSDGGTYVPKQGQGGYGNLGTFITPDQRYEIGVGHLKDLGQQAAGTRSTAPKPTAGTPSSDAALEVLKSLFSGAQKPEEKKQSVAEQLLGETLNSLIAGTGKNKASTFDPYEGYTIDSSVLNQFM